MQLEIEKKNKKLKQTRQAHALKITELKVAESIKSDPGFLKDNPHLISLLALFQEREDFEVDEENMSVKPVNEEQFLCAIEKNIEQLDANLKADAISKDKVLRKERIVEVKNQVLESVKARWISPAGSGRRLSNASQLSTASKRGRKASDGDSVENPPTKPKLKVTSH